MKAFLWIFDIAIIQKVLNGYIQYVSAEDFQIVALHDDDDDIELY